jgi:hypothetical protein
MKPPLTIDLTAPEGNVFPLIAKATATLDQAGQPVQATALRDWFRTVPPLGGVSYDDVRRMGEQYCDVTWVNGRPPPPLRSDIASVLGSGSGTPYLITYDYTESDVAQRCAFICHADNVRAAAESFWGQHPGEWFHLISVNDGSVEAFWVARNGTFVTIPEKEDQELE